MTTPDTDTLTRFRDQHGDPIQWCAAEIDSYTVLGEMAPPVPPPYSHADMQAMSATYARSADVKQALADQLSAEGHDAAAGIWARGAQDARQHADAARLGYPHYEAVLNGW
ncbi:hypothetical protein [Streptomyces sp. NPDC088146]|uniref:hypothetical protein n=1 Tax=Streptomyces sp. NPDC088146 TaxID=3365829 RepID=UPI00382288EA